MSYCLNSDCPRPQNPANTKFCQSCGARLLLGDRYRAIKPIGQGGFGKTFLAEDEHKPSRKLCVIKQFFPQIQSTKHAQKAAELFRQEAVLLDKLGRHPQIPELLAAFSQDQRLYLVQDFIDGQNLAQELVDNGAFNEGQIEQLLHDLLPVLQLLHESKIIHRDIKPENIIRKSSDRRLYLVDFGISKILTNTVAGITGTRIGSPDYVAPEQVMGRAIFASDIFSLGVTCVHLLTNVKRSELYSVAEDKWIWRNYLKSPISEELAQILDKMIERGTKRRYKSVAEVLNDLNSLTSARNTKLIIPSSTIPTFSSQMHWRCLHTILNGDYYWTAKTIISIAVCPQQQLFASGDEDGTIKLWDLITGEEICILSRNFQSRWIYALTFSPNGQMLASSGSNDKTIKLWNWQTKQQIQSFSGHSQSVLTIAISPDSKTLASGSSDKTVIVWDLLTGQEIKTLLGHSDSITSVAFSHDGEHIASASYDKTIKIWNWTTGEKIRQLIDYAGVKCIAISSNRYLVSGNHNCEIKIANIDTAQLIQAFFGHTEGSLFLPSGVSAVTISPDGQIIASGGRRDKTVKLWDLATGKLIQPLNGHLRGVTSVAFSADSKTLVSASYDKTIRIWQRD